MPGQDRAAREGASPQDELRPATLPPVHDFADDAVVGCGSGDVPENACRLLRRESKCVGAYLHETAGSADACERQRRVGSACDNETKAFRQPVGKVGDSGVNDWVSDAMVVIQDNGEFRQLVAISARQRAELRRDRAAVRYLFGKERRGNGNAGIPARAQEVQPPGPRRNSPGRRARRSRQSTLRESLPRPATASRASSCRCLPERTPRSTPKLGAFRNCSTSRRRGRAEIALSGKSLELRRAVAVMNEPFKCRFTVLAVALLRYQTKHFRTG